MPKVQPKVWPDPSVEAEMEAALLVHNKHRVLTLLMAQFGTAIYRYAIAMTRDRNLAEEIRQQVFVDAYRDMEHVAAASAFPMWIFGIARHRCLDAVDSKQRWNQRFKNDLPEDLQPGDDDPRCDLDRRQVARILEVCLSKLTPATCDAVLLRYQQELSYDEAAAIVGNSPDALRRRVSRALLVLRKCVEVNLQAGRSR